MRRLLKLPPWIYGFAYFLLIPMYAIIYAKCPAVALDLGKHDPGYVSSFYFSAITITTLGFGDITPADKWGQLVAASEAILGLFFIGLFLNSLSEQRSRQDKENRDKEIKRIIRPTLDAILSNSYISKLAIEYKFPNPESLTNEQIAQLFLVANFDGESHMARSLQHAVENRGHVDRLSWREVIISHATFVSEKCQEAQLYSEFLDATENELVYKLKNCSFLSLIKSARNSQTVTVLSNHYIQYNELVRQLKEQIDS